MWSRRNNSRRNGSRRNRSRRTRMLLPQKEPGSIREKSCRLRIPATCSGGTNQIAERNHVYTWQFSNSSTRKWTYEADYTLMKNSFWKCGRVASPERPRTKFTVVGLLCYRKCDRSEMLSRRSYFLRSFIAARKFDRSRKISSAKAPSQVLPYFHNLVIFSNSPPLLYYAVCPGTSKQCWTRSSFTSKLSLVHSAREKRRSAWYTLFAHAFNLSKMWGLRAIFWFFRVTWRQSSDSI